MKVKHSGLIVMMDNMQYFGNKRLPQKVSYAITKNLLNLTKHYSCYEKELEKILKFYGEHIEKDDNDENVIGSDGFPVIKDEELSEKMKQEIKDLLDIEIEIDMYQIDQELLDYEDNDRYDPLTLNEILTLNSTIVRQDEETEVDGEENAEEVESL
jgi:hypothetical protein